MDYSGLENRRKRPRVSLDLNVHVNILSLPGGESLAEKEFYCHTRDISFQGIGVISDVQLHPRSKLELQIQSKTPSQNFTFTGMVMWCNYNREEQEYEAGIQIMDPDIPIGWKKLVIDLIVTSS